MLDDQKSGKRILENDQLNEVGPSNKHSQGSWNITKDSRIRNPDSLQNELIKQKARKALETNQTKEIPSISEELLQNEKTHKEVKKLLTLEEVKNELMNNCSIYEEYDSTGSPEGSLGGSSEDKIEFVSDQRQYHNKPVSISRVPDTDQLKAARQEALEAFTKMDSSQEPDLSITKWVYEKANRLIYTNDDLKDWSLDEVRQQIVNDDLTRDQQKQYELDKIHLEQYKLKCLGAYNERYHSERTFYIEDNKEWYGISTMVHGYESGCYRNNFCIDDGSIIEYDSFKRRPPIETWKDIPTAKGRCDEEGYYNRTKPLYWNEILYTQMIIVEIASGKKFDPKSLYAKRIVDPKSLDIMSKISNNNDL